MKFLLVSTKAIIKLKESRKHIKCTQYLKNIWDKTAKTFIDPHNSTNMKKLSIISVHTNLFAQNEGSNDKMHVHECTNKITDVVCTDST